MIIQLMNCPLQSKLEAAMVASAESWARLLNGVPLSKAVFGELGSLRHQEAWAGGCDRWVVIRLW